MSNISQFPLGGDGVCENLFYYLWCKDEDDSGPTINIPDTVIYMYCQPAYWYFTSRQGQIKKKNRSNLTAQKIEEAFTKRRQACDIVGYFLANTPGNENGSGDAMIEYFNVRTLHDFLYNRTKVNNGILQRFIEPKGTRNEMLRSIWSPKVCLLERRVNIRKLQDQQYDMYERAATYEGVEVNSKTAPVRGTFLPTKVQMLNEAVVQHVAEVSFHKYKINRMVLNFKVDPNDQLWLLWCSSMRLEGAPAGVKTNMGPISIDMKVTVPDDVRLSAATSFKRPVNLRRTFSCTSCGNKVEPQRKCQVNYKTVITQFEQAVYDHANEYEPEEFAVPSRNLDSIEQHNKKVGLGSLTWADIDNATKPVVIPPVIQACHPKLSVDDYLRYRKDPLFLYKTTHVCEDCYLVYATIASTEMETPLLMPGLPNNSAPRAQDLSISKLRRSRQNRKVNASVSNFQKKGKKKKAGKSLNRAASAPGHIGRTKTPVGMKKSKAQEFDEELGKAPSLNQFDRIDLETLPPEVRAEMARTRAQQHQAFGGSGIPEDDSYFAAGSTQVKIPPKSDPLHHVVRSTRDVGAAPNYRLPDDQTMGNGAGRSQSRIRAAEDKEVKKLRPYSSAQVLKHAGGEMRIHARSTQSEMAQKKARRRRRQPRRGGGQMDMGGGAQSMEDLPQLSDSAMEHRTFLMETLKQVKRQLEVPETLLDSGAR